MPARTDSDSGRLVFLHGFTQNHHHWHECAHLIARRLDGDPTLAFVDLPGHGLSGGDRTAIAGRPLIDIAGRGTYIGYSMGGRFALHAATTGDPSVERLVVIGATPGIENDHERTERRDLDHERADRVESDGVEAFIDGWLAAPLFESLPADRAGLRHRLGNTAAGLAHSLRTGGTGEYASLWCELPAVDIPVLVLAGEFDRKFTGIGRRMADLLPNGRFAPIANAGHAAHIEQPSGTAEVIADWLATMRVSD